MKRQRFVPEKDGFFGAYWENKEKSNEAIIAMLGDDTEDYMARSGVKWLHKYGVNVMTMSPSRKDYGYHNYPLERIENAIKWLKDNGNRKIGIVGASTTGMLALVAASYFQDITLTIAMTPSDFVWQGFEQGKKDGCKEWPIKGESTVSYRGEPLPYMEFVYQHPQYWQVVEKASKESGDMLNSRKLFDDSEAVRPHNEDEMIKVENIQGKLILIGAEDDSLWDTGKYIRRMEQRLKNRPHQCDYQAVVYKHGTHFVFPETMINTMVPLIGDFVITRLFSAAKKHPKECKETRIDIDRRLVDIINSWRCK